MYNTGSAEDALKCVSNLPHSYVREHCDVITEHCDVIITLVSRADLLPIVYDLLQGLSLKETVQQGNNMGNFEILSTRMVVHFIA